jgi:type II secretory ATPase GspE/PulE/Tfp pilus assembly ATPase PilB-like protein
MKLDEKRKPQDGRFSARIAGRKIDFRVSILPTNFGEKIVIRILDQERGLKALDKIGLSKENLNTMRSAINKPYGLILITGPTGSGKTTTLAAMMNELDREKHNVISLEDPIEYNIDGVNQSQVRPEIEYTFASGLRSVLRQDPDIIMVGEIRDKETAMLAVQAALTGHLVFSTLHTNNAVGVIPRLIDMGVDPYLIAPTLVLAIAQRLVKGSCEESKEPIPIEDSIKVMIDKQIDELPESRRKEIKSGKEVYRARKSPTCPGGTRGRIGVHEMFEINKDVERIILTNPSEIDIENHIRSAGMLNMKDDALIKAFEGVIPFEEVSKL